MTPGSFYYKKDLNESQILETIEVSSEVCFYPKDTIFGKSRPQFWEFYEFIKEPVYTLGAYNYNRLGLDTQVPARFYFATKNKIQTKIETWDNFHIRTEIKEEYYSLFSPIEFMFFDSLTHFNQIGDGYYPTTKDLIRGIKSRAEDVIKRGATINWSLIVTEALKENPNLNKYAKILK